MINYLHKTKIAYHLSKQNTYQSYIKEQVPMQFTEYFSSNHMLLLIISYAQMASITPAAPSDNSIPWPCEPLAW